MANNHNGLDLEVSFDKAADEGTVSQYRIIVLKSADAANFTLQDAENNTSFFPVSPNGNNVQTVLAASTSDTDGDPIADAVAYKIVVLSMADGTNAVVNALSAPSAEVELVANTAAENLAEAGISIWVQGRSVRFSVPAGLKGETLIVSDLAGRKVLEETIASQNGEFTLTYFAEGVVMVSIQTQSGQAYSKKLVIAKQ